MFESCRGRRLHPANVVVRWREAVRVACGGENPERKAGDPEMIVETKMVDHTNRTIQTQANYLHQRSPLPSPQNSGRTRYVHVQQSLLKTTQGGA